MKVYKVYLNRFIKKEESGNSMECKRGIFADEKLQMQIDKKIKGLLNEKPRESTKDVWMGFPVENRENKGYYVLAWVKGFDTQNRKAFIIPFAMLEMGELGSADFYRLAQAVKNYKPLSTEQSVDVNCNTAQQSYIKSNREFYPDFAYAVAGTVVGKTVSVTVHTTQRLLYEVISELWRMNLLLGTAMPDIILLKPEQMKDWLDTEGWKICRYATNSPVLLVEQEDVTFARKELVLQYRFRLLYELIVSQKLGNYWGWRKQENLPNKKYVDAIKDEATREAVWLWYYIEGSELGYRIDKYRPSRGEKQEMLSNMK